MAALRRSLIILGTAALISSSAAAQGTETVPGGTIALIGGGAITSSTTGPLVGATVVYDLTDRMALEGHGAWFDRGSGAEAFALTASMLVNVVPLGRTVVPYGAIGGGMYRASFDLGHPQFFGRPDPSFVPGWWAVTDMPRFYGRRMGIPVMPAGGMWDTRSFTDPAVTFGGGVRLNLAPHLEIRPDARAIVVLEGNDTYTVGTFGVNIGYRF